MARPIGRVNQFQRALARVFSAELLDFLDIRLRDPKAVSGAVDVVLVGARVELHHQEQVLTRHHQPAELRVIAQEILG